MSSDAYLKLQAEQSRLYTKLEALELGSDTGAAQRCLAQILACEAALAKLDASEEAEATQPVAQPAVAVIDPINYAIEEMNMTKTSANVTAPISTPAAQVQPKEASMSQITLESIGVDSTSTSPVTKAQIGVEKFVRPFAGQAMRQTDGGELFFNDYPVAFPVEDSDILLLQAPTSKLTKEFRVHLEQREDVKRAARGLAMFLGGAVQADGTVSNGAGATYKVVDGQCFKQVGFMQTNYDGTKTRVLAPEACKGLIDPKSGESTMRCKHQWALEFASGTFVTVSRKFFFKVVLAEMASILGDDEANEVAKAQYAEWRENGETRQLARITIAQTINDARNTGAVDEKGLIPAATGALDLLLDGKTVRQHIVETNGRMFYAIVDMPAEGKDGLRLLSVKTRACRNAADFASAVAPMAAAAARLQHPLVVKSIVA